MTLRVLIVDDEAPARERLRSLLEEIGDARVVGEAANGEEALHLVDEQAPDIVLLDLKLPRIDGLQVLREIRANAKTSHLPVMVVTSSSEDNDLAAAEQLGATSYSVKPTHAREYADLIQALVNQGLNI